MLLGCAISFTAIRPQSDLWRYWSHQPLVDFITSNKQTKQLIIHQWKCLIVPQRSTLRPVIVITPLRWIKCHLNCDFYQHHVSHIDSFTYLKQIVKVMDRQEQRCLSVSLHRLPNRSAVQHGMQLLSSLFPKAKKLFPNPICLSLPDLEGK